MKEKTDCSIGTVVGFQIDDFIYIATIIDINDEMEQFTVRTEDGQELTGPFEAVFLNPEDRMDKLHEQYELLGDGKFRAKNRSNWVPVSDPNARYIAGASASIIGIGIVLLVCVTLMSIGDVITQIQSAGWVENEGTVIEAYDEINCTNDSGDSIECTTIKVAYTYDGRNYTTMDYSILSEDWLNDKEYWLDQETVTVHVNPDNPAQAIYLAGWPGFLEEVLTLFFFVGFILAGYLTVGVPVWFVYAKIQRWNGIEAPQKNSEQAHLREDNTADQTSETAPHEDETSTEEEKFW